MTNFLNSYKAKTANWWNRQPRWKRWFFIAIGVVLSVIIALGLWALVNIRTAQEIVQHGLDGKQSFEYAQVAIVNQDFELAAQDLAEAKASFTQAQDKFARFGVYKAIPGAARQIKAVDNMLDASINLSNGLEKLVAVGVDINEVLAEKDGDVSFDDITQEEKGLILTALNESSVDLQSVKSDIELAVLSIEAIPDDGLVSQIEEVVTPVKEQLPLLESVVTQAIPLAQTLPSILGSPEGKTYLFLLQNNRELRPTGGFIGTYGILKMYNGEIGYFETDNIYNLDNKVAGKISEPAPGPIQVHTSTQEN